MQVYYLQKNEFLKRCKDISFLQKFSDGKVYLNKDKELEHLLGLFIVDYIAKNVYKIKNTESERVENKPKFKNINNLYFSVSHSEDYVLVGFDNNEIGIDIEKIKDRKIYKSILKRFNQDCDNKTIDDFYQFWTQYEAKYKLNKDECKFRTLKFKQYYYVTIASESDIVKTEIIDFIGIYKF